MGLLGSGQLSTHDKVSDLQVGGSCHVLNHTSTLLQVMHVATPCARLSAVQSTYRNFDVIGIDEGTVLNTFANHTMLTFDLFNRPVLPRPQRVLRDGC